MDFLLETPTLWPILDFWHLEMYENKYVLL